MGSNRSAHILLLLAMLLSGFAASNASDAIDPSLRKAIDDAVEKEMARQQAVGVAIGVIQDGEVAYTACYGWADREKKVRVGRKTLFRWASIGKPLTAVVAMQLFEQGKLDLDADIREAVPEFPDKGTPITMRQLLGHLGGIVHYTNGPVIETKRDYSMRHPYKDVILALDRFKESPLVAKPGAKFAYTTHGYILASAVIQRCGEQPFALQIRDRISKPLKLKTLRPDYQWQRFPGRAVGYRIKDGQITPSTDTDVSWKLGGGGWVSNIDDLATFASALAGDELLSRETRQMMWTAQETSDGKKTGYGLGFGLSGSGSDLKVLHTGVQEKVRTRMEIYPEKKYGVVVMTNSENAEPGDMMAVIDNAIREHSRSTSGDVGATTVSD